MDLRKLQRRHVALMIVGLASGWLGCQTFDIQTDHDPAVDFSALASYAWQPETVPRAGTLLLDVLDSTSHQLIWRASASARITSESSEEKRDKKLQAAVHDILERFPPTGK